MGVRVSGTDTEATRPVAFIGDQLILCRDNTHIQRAVGTTSFV